MEHSLRRQSALDAVIAPLLLIRVSVWASEGPK